MNLKKKKTINSKHFLTQKKEHFPPLSLKNFPLKRPMNKRRSLS